MPLRSRAPTIVQLPDRVVGGSAPLIARPSGGSVAHYRDLEPCDYVRLNLARRHLALAIGWLDPGFSYPQGDVPDSFLDRLAELSSSAGHPHATYFGSHMCELSGLCREQGSAAPSGRFPVSSSQEIFVPYEGCLFVSPDNIGHYIVAHGYAPPKVYIRAVESCPSVAGEDYHEQTWRFFRLTGEDLGPVPEVVPWL